MFCVFFFSSRRRHTRCLSDWSSDVCSSDLIYADRDKVQQVLLNIVDNALKFTPSGGSIELAVFSEERHTVAITVRDTGQGISPEALPYVFDRFYRADPTRSRQSSQKSGNGLGLAIAKELIEAQRGTIHIESTLGKGTTVAIRFPCVQEKGKPPAECPSSLQQ